MRTFLCTLALLSAFTLVSAAHADPMSDPVSGSGSGGGFSGSGTLYGTSNGDGSYTITGITGTGVGDLIDAGSFNSNDNMLFPSQSSVVDGNGFAFTDSQGDTSFNVDIYSDGSGAYYAYLDDSDSFTETIPISLSIDNTSGDEPNQFRSFQSPDSVLPTQSFNFVFGTAAVTPEPSSLLLLGTGILGGAGVLSRRLSRRKR